MTNCQSALHVGANRQTTFNSQFRREPELWLNIKPGHRHYDEFS